jgi:hypothetical protein
MIERTGTAVRTGACPVARLTDPTTVAPAHPATERATTCVGRALGHTIAAMALAAAATSAFAHKASDAYLRLAVEGEQVTQRLDIALRDLDRDLGLDADGDARLSWGEVRRRWSEIDALATRHVRLAADGRPCTPSAQPLDEPALDRHSDGTYAVLQRTWRCPASARALELSYDLFAKTDPQHRGIVRIDAGAPAPATAVLGPQRPLERFERFEPAMRDAGKDEGGATTATPSSALAVREGEPAVDTHDARASTHPGPDTLAGAFASTRTTAPGHLAAALSRFGGFVAEGVHHILIGADHVIFLLTLLLPLVRQRRPGVPALARGPGAAALAPVLKEVLKVVTAFTVAHSITLALAVLGVVAPPSRWVESLIAASVLLAALNNLWPVVPHRWGLTFAFGLVHGFGFAGAMQGLALDGGSLVAPLLGFNLGVEIGQALIVAAVLPLAWALRHGRFYSRAVLGGGSLAAAAVAGVWLVERAFEVTLLGGA